MELIKHMQGFEPFIYNCDFLNFGVMWAKFDIDVIFVLLYGVEICSLVNFWMTECLKRWLIWFCLESMSRFNLLIYE